jgi:hypothetical protein
MNCLDYRRAIGADPHLVSAELASHAGACPACAEFGAEMRALDERIAAALRIPVPNTSTSESRAPVRRLRLPLAMAASFLLAVTVAAVLWLSLPRESLAHAVIEHMRHEPASLVAHDPVSTAALEEVLRKSDAHTQGSLGRVTYAMSCWFRGHYVSHLVVDEGHGPVTVMLLAHEKVAQPVHFSEGGFTGVIVPAAQGSIAVLTRDESQVEAIAARVAKVLE